MASNQTTNYGLHLWEPEDNFLRTEFNDNNEILDEMLAEVMASVPNVQTGNYTGNGSASRTFNFSFPPRLLLISSHSTGVGHQILVSGQTTACPCGGSTLVSVAWTGNSVTLSVADSINAFALCNTSGVNYSYLVLG